LPPLRASDYTDAFSKRLARGATEPAAVIDLEHFALLDSCYSEILSESSALTIAAHRLRSSESQSDTEQADVILDLCIGIESLLSDSAADMTYKLGTRAAAVLGLQGWDHPSEYSDAIKKIYERRSAIVHGRGSASKSATITVAGRPWVADDLARAILRELMLDRHADPTLDSKAIDTRLIGPAIDAFFKTR
jgi:hypothetical protein